MCEREREREERERERRGTRKGGKERAEGRGLSHSETRHK